MTETKVEILNQYKEKLIGIVSTPSTQKEKYATVILAHGFSANKDESGLFSDIAKNLSKIGILVLRFDFSGCGESEGDYSETSLSKLKSDLSSVIDFVQAHPKVDTTRIGILGQSMGTSAIITLEPKVKCLVLMGATPYPKKALMKLFGEGYNPNGISTRIKPSGTVTKIKSEFWKDFDSHNLIKSIKNIHCPILFVHGEQDDKVAISEMEEYFQNAHEPKEKIIIEGSDHGLNPHRDKAYDFIEDWYGNYLM